MPWYGMSVSIFEILKYFKVEHEHIKTSCFWTKLQKGFAC